MLYHLFKYLNNHFDFPGSGLFEFISFRAGMAVITSLVITLVFGGRLIKFLQRKLEKPFNYYRNLSISKTFFVEKIVQKIKAFFYFLFYLSHFCKVSNSNNSYYTWKNN